MKVIDDKNHVLFLNENDVEIKIKDVPISPMKIIPEIPEEPPEPKKKTVKKTKPKK